ncbi:MBL fold metallo-hydrolase [Thermodesulfatator atlanticus]|uniref:MBL fold metallo-hydrolase n=1 Tax=Thermodesulfatator atlanticus TaxID=501497 RepID=UPI0003B66A1A|nr:MBL fold metallo-hydrolase [Thermodesulfatator atlanticus]
MEILILAAESLGVRSMATFVRTKDVSVLIDPGAALGPKRYGLPPDKIEWQKLREIKALIKDKIREADLVIISHYHYDHYDPEWAKELKGKQLLLKNPEKDINRNQAKRAKELLKRLAAFGVCWKIAEGMRLIFGETEIVCSPPLNHGPDERFGAVVATVIKENGKVFLHSSDVSGPVQQEALNFIYKHSPQILFIDGPASYLGPRFGLEALELARKNLVSLTLELKPEFLIMDHHLLRDLSWKTWAENVFSEAVKTNTKVLCAADFMKKKPLLLEALRKDRYKALSKKICKY